MRKHLLFLILIIISFVRVGAQTTRMQESWLDYLNQNRYTDKWGSWIDVQSKLKDHYINAINANEFTLGASYFPNKNFKYTGAVTYVDQFPSTGKNYHLAEYRPWQQIQYTFQKPTSQWLQWLRLEERFKQTAINNLSSDNYDFTYRLRYFLLAQFPLTQHKYEKGSLSFVTSEELYVNFGKNIVYNTFDQNRFFLGFYYYLNKDNILQLGYTNLYQMYNAKNKFLQSDVLRISVFNNIDFRKK
jgi:hypothetical protein